MIFKRLKEIHHELAMIRGLLLGIYNVLLLQNGIITKEAHSKLIDEELRRRGWDNVSVPNWVYQTAEKQEK